MRSVCLVLSTLFLGAALPAHAAPPAAAPGILAPIAGEKPEQFLRRSLDHLLQLAAANKQQDPRTLAKTVRPALEKVFNFESLTRKALGQAWRELSPEQQRQAVASFSELIIRTYTTRFDPTSKLEIDFNRSAQLAEGKMEVPAVAKHQGNNVSVAYRVENSPRGWVVYDVIIEGVSLTQNFRVQFDEIRQRGSAVQILRTLEDKIK
jgi:phospholipid transport system substrate-binding protein